MNKLFFVTLTILFNNFQWQQVTASQTPQIPTLFTIPIVDNEPDFDHANLPLCNHRPDISDVAKLFIMAHKLDTLLQESSMSQYTKSQQRKITHDVIDMQKQIQNMACDALQFHEPLNDRRKNSTSMMLQQDLLIWKIHQLQTFQNLASRKTFNELAEKLS